jgi:hypothetical protein
MLDCPSVGQVGNRTVPEIVEHKVLDLLFRPYRRVPVRCFVTYHTGPFIDMGTVWNLSYHILAGVSQGLAAATGRNPLGTVTLPNGQCTEVPRAVVPWSRGARACSGECREQAAHPRLAQALCETPTV